VAQVRLVLVAGIRVRLSDQGLDRVYFCLEINPANTSLLRDQGTISRPVRLVSKIGKMNT